VRYLLDTNVISELQKSNCSERVKSFLYALNWDDLYITALTLGEISYGIEKLPHGKKKHDLSIWLYTEIPKWFDGRIITFDSEIMLEWGKIRALSERTLPVADTMIAAAAIVHHLFLITRNTKDFEDIEGINLLNPWEF